MTADDQHADLRASWRELRDWLSGLPKLLHWPAQVEQMEIRDKADRVRSLGLHLQAALDLMDDHKYAPALAVLRTGLEHLVVDWLVFQGRTFVQRISNVDEASWARWQQDRAAAAEWTSTIRDWNRTRKGAVRIVHEGLFSEPDEQGKRQQVSIYYFLLEQYQPALGPPSQQQDNGVASAAGLRALAEENRALWEVYLTWSSLMVNLRENHLVTEEDAGRLAVHYRFLSGYAHPVADQRRALYGKDALLGWPKFDHFSSELIMLYALTFATSELRHFLASVSKRADVSVNQAERIEQALARAESLTGYFWFIGDRPHAYDTWRAQNTVAFRSWRETGGTGSSPRQVAPIPYPTDPLKRIIAMHRSTQELTTGLSYTSPWPRADAQFR